MLDGSSHDATLLKEALASYKTLFLPYQARLRDFRKMLEPVRQGEIAAWSTTGAGVDRQLQLSRSQVVSIWPRVVTNAIQQRYLTSRPTWRVITDDDPGNIVTAEALTRDVDGLFLALDDWYSDTKQGFSWDAALKASIVQFGKSIQRPGIVKDGDYLQPVSPLIDPAHFYHDIGPSNPCFYIHERKLKMARVQGELDMMRASAQIPAKLLEMKGDTEVEFAHIYMQEKKDGITKTHEAVLLNGEAIVLNHGGDSAAYARESPYFGERKPYIVTPMPAGAFPLSEQGSDAEYHAEPIYAPAKRIIEQIEGLQSLLADSAAFAAKPPLIVERDTRDNNDVVRLNPGERTETTTGAVKVSSVQMTSTSPFIAESMLQTFYDMLDTLVPLRMMQAMTNPGDSTSLNRQQIDTAEKALAPITRAIERAKQDTAYWFLDALSHENEGSVMRVLVTQDADGKDRRTAVRKLTKKNIPTYFRVSVEEPPEFPNDLLKEMQTIAQEQATGMWPDTEIAARHGEPRPHAMKEKALAEKVQDHPAMVVLRVLDTLRGKLAAAEAEYAIASTERARHAAFIKVETLKGDVAGQEAALGGGQSPRQSPDAMGIAPAQQSQEDMGANSLTDMRVAGRSPVPSPGGR